MRRINLFVLFYLVLLVLSLNAPHGLAGSRESKGYEKGSTSYPSHTSYRSFWFTIMYKDRFWRVDTDGNIYFLLPEDDFSVRPVVTGLRVDEETGRIAGVLEVLPKQIPEEIFEINISERYVTLQNGAIVKFVDISELKACFETITLTHEYLLPRVIYFFSKGKIYKIG